MDAIDIGKRQGGRHGRAGSTGVYAGFGGGLCPKKGAAKALSAGIADNPLKKLISRKEIDLDFLLKNLDFLSSGLDFLSSGLDFLAPGLEILPCGWEGRPRPGLSVPAKERRRLP